MLRLIRNKSAADHGDQTSIVPIRHVAAESAPATVGGGIVATHAGLQRTETGKNNV